MKLLYITVAFVVAGAVGCSEPGDITARMDPSTTGSGTLGSVRATDGVPPIEHSGIPPGPKDTILHRDTLLQKR